MKFFILLMFVSLFSCKKELPLNSNVASQLPIVNAATAYSWGWVGTPARPSDAELAARVLYRTASSSQLYDAIEQASPEGKMYLLCVLIKKDEVLFTKALAGLSKNELETVSVFTGDVLRRVPVNSVIENIRHDKCSGLDWSESFKK